MSRLAYRYRGQLRRSYHVMWWNALCPERRTWMLKRYGVGVLALVPTA